MGRWVRHKADAANGKAQPRFSSGTELAVNSCRAPIITLTNSRPHFSGNPSATHTFHNPPSGLGPVYSFHFLGLLKGNVTPRPFWFWSSTRSFAPVFLQLFYHTSITAKPSFSLNHLIFPTADSSRFHPTGNPSSTQNTNLASVFTSHPFQLHRRPCAPQRHLHQSRDHLPAIHPSNNVIARSLRLRRP